jgi:hypothetical protein
MRRRRDERAFEGPHALASVGAFFVVYLDPDDLAEAQKVRRGHKDYLHPGWYWSARQGFAELADGPFRGSRAAYRAAVKYLTKA